MEPHTPFTVLVADDATRAAGQAFDEAARLAARIPLSRLHVAYVLAADTSLATLEQIAPSLRADTVGRAQELHASDRLLAIHLRAGDPVNAITTLAYDLGADLVVTTTPRWRDLMSRDVVARLHEELECPLVAVSPLSHSIPEVEPICPMCAMIRERTNGKVFWCGQHGRHHIRAHGWSYQREYSFATHDSQFIPTGVAF